MGEMTRHYVYGTRISKEWRWIYAKSAFVPGPGTLPLDLIATESPFHEIVSELNIGFLPANAHTSIALGILEFAAYGLAVDYSNVDYGTAPLCGTGNCAYGGILPWHTPVSLCGKCIDSSDIGNMMFGLGGAARGYDPAFTYVSATGYNVLTGEPIFSPDGKGAIPGYLIAITGAYLNQWAFCGILKSTKFIGYNELGDIYANCKACKKIMFLAN